MVSTWKEWTSQDEEVLRELYDQGKSVDYIAHDLERSIQSVKVKAFRMGLSRTRTGTDTDKSRTPALEHKRLTETDIATRIASLLGEAPRIEVSAKEFSDQQLLSYTEGVRGLGTFLKDLVDVELLSYQVEIAEKLLGPRSLVVVSGRQVGKDYVISAFSLWESIVKPNSKIVIVSAAQRQSDLLGDKILGFIALSDQLYVSVKKTSRERIDFRNGSEVWFLPSTGLIRGISEASRVIINEGRDVPDTTYDMVSPMLARRAGHLSLFSTPLGRVGYLWTAWNSPLFDRVHVRSDQNPYLSAEYLEGEKARMSIMSFKCEYEGDFVSSQQNYLDPVAVDKAVEDYQMSVVSRGVEGQTRYSVGIDWGRTKDASVMTVLGQDPDGGVKVHFIKSFEGVSFEEQIPYVSYLKDLFHPVKIISEHAGLSIGVNDALIRNGTGIEKFVPTNESKSRLYDNLRGFFDRLEITIPADPPTLRRELLLLEYEALPSGAVRIGHASGGHDDYADSLALAAWAFHRGRFVPQLGGKLGDFGSLTRPMPGRSWRW